MVKQARTPTNSLWRTILLWVLVFNLGPLIAMLISSYGYGAGESLILTLIVNVYALPAVLAERFLDFSDTLFVVTVPFWAALSSVCGYARWALKERRRRTML
jgi:hypothetical protein